MILKYSDNPFKQVFGIAYYNRKSIFLFSLISILAEVQFQFAPSYGWEPIEIPIVPVTILGGALAIFWVSETIAPTTAGGRRGRFGAALSMRAGLGA